MKPAVAGPRSLLWRLGFLALAVTLVSLLLHVLVISIWVQPLLEMSFGQLAARTQLARALVQATPAAERDKLAQQVSDPGFRLQRVDAQGPLPQTPPPRLLERLAQHVAPGIEVKVAPAALQSLDGRVLWLDFAVEEQAWRVETSVQPPFRALLGTGIGWALLAALAVAASLLVGLRFVVRPIRQVAERIASQESSLQPVAMPAGASAELQALVSTFNRLVERVRAADRIRQHLLAGLSHDLRTPLARLRLRIETQCTGDVADAAEPELKAVEHIVAQFLAFVQGNGEAGLGQHGSLLDTVRRVVAAYADQGVQVHCAIGAEDTAVQTLAAQRLLTNLIDNALAHGRQPVELGWSSRATGESELAVWDHGAGMSQAQFAAAREPFVRLGQAGGIGHCGLGLAIVDQIARQWGAQLHCHTDESGRFGILLVWRAARLGRSTCTTQPGSPAAIRR